MTEFMRDELGVPNIVDRAMFQAELDALWVREKAHTHQFDAIAAARRCLLMVEVDASIPLMGPGGAVTLLDTFDARRQLIAYYFMWHTGHAQCGPGIIQHRLAVTDSTELRAYDLGLETRSGSACAA